MFAGGVHPNARRFPCRSPANRHGCAFMETHSAISAHGVDRPPGWSPGRYVKDQALPSTERQYYTIRPLSGTSAKEKKIVQDFPQRILISRLPTREPPVKRPSRGVCPRLVPICNTPQLVNRFCSQDCTRFCRDPSIGILATAKKLSKIFRNEFSFHGCQLANRP